MKNIIIWTSALLIGTLLGLLGIAWVDTATTVVATIYTRLFQLVAVPTIALAVITTLASLSDQREAGRIFLHTLSFTLLTTFAAAAIGAVLYVTIAPNNLPSALISGGQEAAGDQLSHTSYLDHLLSLIPSDIITPLSSGNVLSVLLLSAAIGLALAFMPASDNVRTLLRGIFGLQELLFTLIRALVWTLPVGIVALKSPRAWLWGL